MTKPGAGRVTLIPYDTEPAKTVEMEADVLVLVGTNPVPELLNEADDEVAALLRGRRIEAIEVPAAKPSSLSRLQLALFTRGGKLCVAQLGRNPVRVQPLGCPTGSAGPLPGELLPPAATLWLPQTHPASRTRLRRLAVINPGAYRTRAEAGAVADHDEVVEHVPGTVDEDLGPRPSPARLDAIADRFGEYFRFPAEEPFPGLPVMSAETEERLRRLRARIQDWGLKGLANDTMFVATLLDRDLLFLDDLVQTYPVLEDLVSTVGELERRRGRP